jgi:hypothetical protein
MVLALVAVLTCGSTFGNMFVAPSIIGTATGSLNITLFGP